MYKRQIVALGAVAGLTVAMTLAPAAQATPMQGGKVTVTQGGPTITALPLPAGETSGDILSATSRWAVGLVADDAQVQHVAVWRRQAAGMWSVNDLGDLGFSEPSSGLSATGVNSRGQVAIGINTEVGMGGWLYYRGVFHRLSDFAGGKNAFARAINASGEVVGEALDAQGNDYAAVWRYWWSAPVRLAPTTGMDGSFAQGVNSHGKVAGGSFSNGPAPTRAVVWGRHGTPRILADLGAGGDAADINTRGRTVGRVFGSVDSEAAVWDQGRLRNLGVFSDDTFSRAIGVGETGEVVGFAGTRPSSGIPLRQLVFWPGYGPTRSLLPLDLDWNDNAYAHAIVGDTVFGTSMASHGTPERPTVWTQARAQSFVPAGTSSTGPATAPRVVFATNAAR